MGNCDRDSGKIMQTVSVEFCPKCGAIISTEGHKCPDRETECCADESVRKRFIKRTVAKHADVYRELGRR